MFEPYDKADPLLAGAYTVTKAARLLRLPDRRRVSRWVGGEDAVIFGDYASSGVTREVSFWDLFEIRFVETFRAEGFSLQFLRKVATRLRTELKTRHPFARSGVRFKTDRKRIFEVISREEDSEVFEIFNRQQEMYEVIEQSLEVGAEGLSEFLCARRGDPRLAR